MTRPRGVLVLALLSPLFVGADGCDDQETQQRRWEENRWEAPCRDSSTLLATTTGSPNSITCPNKHHRLRVQPVTVAAREEIGALAFCECVRPGEPAPKPVASGAAP